MLIMVPLLALLLKYAREAKQSVQMTNLYKLVVQCLERLAASDPKEMKQLLASSIPPQILTEIQNAAKAKGNEQQKQRPAQIVQKKLTIDFEAYGAQKK